MMVVDTDCYNGDDDDSDDDVSDDDDDGDCHNGTGDCGNHGCH